MWDMIHLHNKDNKDAIKDIARSYCINDTKMKKEGCESCCPTQDCYSSLHRDLDVSILSIKKCTVCTTKNVLRSWLRIVYRALEFLQGAPVRSSRDCLIQNVFSAFINSLRSFDSSASSPANPRIGSLTIWLPAGCRRRYLCSDSLTRNAVTVVSLTSPRPKVKISFRSPAFTSLEWDGITCSRAYSQRVSIPRAAPKKHLLKRGRGEYPRVPKGNLPVEPCF